MLNLLFSQKKKHESVMLVLFKLQKCINLDNQLELKKYIIRAYDKTGKKLIYLTLASMETYSL